MWAVADSVLLISPLLVLLALSPDLAGLDWTTGKPVAILASAGDWDHVLARTFLFDSWHKQGKTKGRRCSGLFESMMVRRMDRKTGEIYESNSLKDPSRDRVVQGDAGCRALLPKVLM